MKYLLLILLMLPLFSFAEDSSLDPNTFYFIQMASFKDSQKARGLMEEIQRDKYAVATSFIPRKKDVLTVVFIGPFADKADAEKHRKIMSKKLSLGDTFVVEANGSLTGP